MFTRKSRKLVGPVHTVECEFAVFETKDGQTVEARHEPACFERYDLDGRLLEEISAERLLINQVYRDVYIYDDQGDLIEREEYGYGEDGVLTGKHVWGKGKDGNRIEKHYYVGRTNILTLGSILFFNSDNEFVDVTHYDESGNALPKTPEYPTTKTITTRIDEFTIEERRFDLDGSPSTSIVRSYDPNGNEKEFSCIEPDGTLSIKEEYEYEFDTTGNWTSMKAYRWVIGWGEFHLFPSTITRRKIVYY